MNKTTDKEWVHQPSGQAYSGYFEGFHQVHCLVSTLHTCVDFFLFRSCTLNSLKPQSLIRQYTYRDEYDFTGLVHWDQGPEQMKLHIEHCVELLRVNLMCLADVTPYLLYHGNDGKVGVEVRKPAKCKDYENLQEWTRDNSET